MKIEVAADPVEVIGPEVEFTLADDGGAHVFIIFAIVDVDAFEHAEANQGSKSKVIPLQVGKTYKARANFAAHTYQSLGRTFKTEVRANGAAIAWADGSIPSNQDSDRAYRSFKIKVVS